MGDDPKDPRHKKAKISADSSSDEESIDEIDDHGPAVLEYADIRSEADLLRHLSFPREASIGKRRYKLSVMERALHKWYLRADKYVCTEVNIKICPLACNFCV